MCIIVTLDSGQAPLDWNPIWVEMKEKGLESIDAENLWKIRTNLQVASFHLSLFYFVSQKNLADKLAWLPSIPFWKRMGGFSSSDMLLNSYETQLLRGADNTLRLLSVHTVGLLAAQNLGFASSLFADSLNLLFTIPLRFAIPTIPS